MRKQLPNIIIVALTAALVAITHWHLLGKYTPTGQVEVAAVVFTGLSVWQAAKNSLWNWITGIIGCGLYLYLFVEWKLFADAWLQIVYIVLSVIGLYVWWKIRTNAEPEAKRVGKLHLLAVLVMVGITTWIAQGYLAHFHDAAPFWDALFTAGSLGAQYLLIRKYIENWWIWMVLDAGYVALFITRGWYLTAALYVLFFGIVIKAAIDWRQYLPDEGVKHEDRSDSRQVPTVPQRAQVSH
jgi:nicotinamide mononucleotide transporter